jgi:hypothetical protein
MYQPLLRPDQVHALYLLKRWLRRPMTKILQAAVDEYLRIQREQHGQPIVVDEAPTRK